MRTLPFLLLSLGAPALFAAEGVVLEQKIENLADGSAFTTAIYLTPNRVATETVTDGRRMGFIYLADEQVMRVLDHDRQSYSELTQQDLERVAEQMRKMREQFENMPPEQRAMMEKMMQGRMKDLMAAAEPSEPVRFERTGEGSSVNGYDCVYYEGYEGEEKVARMCAIDFEDVDVAREDFAIFGRMGEFFSRMAPQMAERFAAFGAAIDDEQRVPGVPAEQTVFEDGKPQSRTTLQKLGREEIDESRFEVPAKYKKRKGVPGGR